MRQSVLVYALALFVTPLAVHGELSPVGGYDSNKSFIYVNADVYNIRDTNNFDSAQNITSQAQRGTVFPIFATEKSQTGIKVKISQQPDRWIFKSSQPGRDRELLFCANPDCTDLGKDAISGLTEVGKEECEACKYQPWFRGEAMPDHANMTPAKIAPPTTKKMAKACEQLISSDGKLGEWGKTLGDVMDRSDNAQQLYKSAALGPLCPKFNRLPPDQKKAAWVWFWTALAQEESSCRPSLVHGLTYKDRNGTVRALNPTLGTGLWAMEAIDKVRKWRGPECADVKSVKGQAMCSVSIMRKQLAKHDITWQSSYWGPLRRKDKQLMPHMRRFSECF